jgi:hypothetical protein
MGSVMPYLSGEIDVRLMVGACTLPTCAAGVPLNEDKLVTRVQPYSLLLSLIGTLEVRGPRHSASIRGLTLYMLGAGGLGRMRATSSSSLASLR